MGLIYIVYAWWYGRKHGLKGDPWSKKEIWTATKDAAWGLGVPGLILGGIYGGIFTPTEAAAVAVIYSLLALRQNIYTDPQKPIQVSPGLYEIGEPEPGSPLLVTTNFSLTYFSVAGEVEGSGRKAWLLVADSEGLSVLTAWAAGKFDAEAIAKAVKSTGVADKINHKSIVLPGAVAGLSGELEEELRHRPEVRRRCEADDLVRREVDVAARDDVDEVERDREAFRERLARKARVAGSGVVADGAAHRAFLREWSWDAWRIPL
jgi:hypothetical protein